LVFTKALARHVDCPTAYSGRLFAAHLPPIYCVRFVA